MRFITEGSSQLTCVRWALACRLSTDPRPTAGRCSTRTRRQDRLIRDLLWHGRRRLGLRP